MQAASSFLEALLKAVPYRIHTVLTDNGIQFADLPKNRQGLTARFRGHPFDCVCPPTVSITASPSPTIPGRTDRSKG